MIAARALYRAWRLCRAAELDLFSVESIEPLVSLPGWDALGLPSHGLDGGLLEALRAIELRHRDTNAEQNSTRLVATVPIALGIVAATRDVATTLIRSAKRELLVVGYAMRETEFCRLLCTKGLEGVRVTAISDRAEDDAKALFEMWPARAATLAAYRGTEGAYGQALMHAKTVVADRERALIGSANFTVGGFRSNIEIGVEVIGTVAAELVTLVERLVGNKWLERVTRSSR